jgi:DNA-binding NarL/FixJ family response regulator
MVVGAEIPETDMMLLQRDHRPPVPHRPRHQRQEALQRRDAGETTVEIARSYNISHSTISRLEA